ncbi:MAG: AbrB/MazE/SpoVT family DNA-binding domain-containing protein [Euryarchaeota archaeon]|nr:AbrB/MazE/SpoVT family DNA-binding domain-containing protein [Euryarchaeota archaeon]
MATTVDERGRVLIPRGIREEQGLAPGSPVIIESTKDGVLLRPALQREEALRRLNGAINVKNRKRGVEPMDPLAVKQIWEPRT